MAQRVFVYEFRAKMSGLTAGLTAGSKAVGDFGGKLTALDRQGERMRAGLTQLGDGAGKVGLVAAAGLGAIIAVTTKFESAMSRVAAATNTSASELGELRQAAIDLGADTIFSATEAADGITELGKAGLSTADILGGGLKGALDLAAAGQISVASAAETTAITLSQYGLAGSEASQVSDALAAGAGKALGSVEDMAGALKYVGPVASQMGVSLEETTGAIAELASQGILGEQAGTSLRGMLTSLTSPSKVASEQMSDLGISMYDAQGQFIGLDGIAGQLKTSMGDLTNAERDEALGRIFGNEQVTAARVLYAGGAEAVRTWTDRVTDSGYAAEQAAKLTDNFAGDLEQLKGSLESALIGAGEGSQGPLRSLTQGLTGVVDKFNELPSAAKSGVTGLLAITAITGGAAFFGAKVIGGIANTKQALQDLGYTAERTGAKFDTLGAAGSAAKFAGMVGALTVVNDLISQIDTGINQTDLDRNLLSFANGGKVADFDGLAEDIRRFNQARNAVGEPLEEIASGFGLIGDTGLDKAQDEIEKIDQALAGLAESGRADEAAAAFARISAAASESGVSVDDTRKTFDAYNTALDNLSRTDAVEALQRLVPGLGAATGATDEWDVATRAAADAAGEAAAAVGEMVKAMQDQYDAAVGAFDAVTQYRQALKDAREQADKTDAGIRGSSEAALENRSRISALAGAWNAQSDAAKNAPGAYRAARQAFIDTARDMGVPREAAKRLADELLQIPPKRVSTVTVETGQARTAIDVIKSMLAGVNGTEAKTYVTTIRRTRNEGSTSGMGPRRDSSIEGGGGRGPRSGGSGPRGGGSGPAGASLSGGGSGQGGPTREGQRTRRDDDDRPRVVERITNGFGQNSRGGVDYSGLVARIRDGDRREIRTDLRERATGDTPRARLAFYKDFGEDARKALRGLQSSLTSATQAVSDNETAVKREEQERDNLASMFSGLVASIASQFKSVLFEPLSDQVDVWRSDSMGAGGTADPIAQLQADLAATAEFNGLYSSLEARFAAGGIDNDGLTAAAEQGQDALATLSAYTDEQLRQYGDLYVQREQAASAAGRAVAQQEYGAAVAREAAELAAANASLVTANANLVAIQTAIAQTTRVTEVAGEAITQEQKKVRSSAAKGQRDRRARRRD